VAGEAAFVGADVVEAGEEVDVVVGSAVVVVAGSVDDVVVSPGDPDARTVVGLRSAPGAMRATTATATSTVHPAIPTMTTRRRLTAPRVSVRPR
jgi:hypothetical protein